MDIRWQILDQARGVFAVERHQGGACDLRATVVRLARGDLLVQSPVRGLTDEVAAALDAVGPVRWLLAPNHFHNLGLAPWQDRYPDAVIVGADPARARLAQKSGRTVAGLDALAPALDARVAVFALAGTRAGETFVDVHDGTERVWIVGDAFMALAQPWTTAVGLAYRAMGFFPGLRVSWSFPRIAVQDRAACRRDLLARLATAPPTMLVPAHGEVVRGPHLAARLTALVEKSI